MNDILKHLELDGIYHFITHQGDVRLYSFDDAL